MTWHLKDSTNGLSDHPVVSISWCVQKYPLHQKSLRIPSYFESFSTRSRFQVGFQMRKIFAMPICEYLILLKYSLRPLCVIIYRGKRGGGEVGEFIYSSSISTLSNGW